MINYNSYPTLEDYYYTPQEGTLARKALYYKSFLTNEYNQIFQAWKDKINLSFFWKLNKKRQGYMFEILFHGFNFSSKRYRLRRLKYYVDVHKSELYICPESVTSTFKSRVYKRRLIFFSYDHDLIYNIQKSIKAFQPPNVYSGKGLFERNDSYIVKKRRKRR